MFTPKYFLIGLLFSRMCAMCSDFTEGNAVAWETFASDGAVARVFDDSDRVKAGANSIRFETESGFDTGVRFPKTADGHWDASAKTHLTFWSYAINANSGFQGNQPAVVLKTSTGNYRYEPEGILTANRGWAVIRVPLTGGDGWQQTSTGTPNLSDILQIEIHQDTWESGFKVWYDGLDFVSLQPGGTPSAGPPPPPGVNPDALRPKALLYVYDPLVASRDNKPLHQVYGWFDPLQLTDQVVNDLFNSSHGLVQYQVIETNIVNGYPFHLDGFQYDDGTFAEAWKTRNFHESGFDYARFIKDHGIGPRIENGEADEVWIYAFPGAGLWESTMAGDGGYWCNSSPVQGAPSSRLFVVMGWNYERGVAEAIHSYGHRTESIMVHSYKRWEQQRVNNWSAFALLDKDAPRLGGVGNVHYPVNALSDYEYGSDRTVISTAEDWYNYPNFKGITSSVNVRTWSPQLGDSHRDYLNWWFHHIPHFPAKGPDFFLNNWWRYIVDVEQFKTGDGNLKYSIGIPSVRIVSPANDATVTGVVEVKTEASVDGALGRVDLYIDDAYHSSDTLSPYTFRWDTSGLREEHTLVARAYELQNGTEAVSQAVSVMVRGYDIGGKVVEGEQGIVGMKIGLAADLQRSLTLISTSSVSIPDNATNGIVSVIEFYEGVGTIQNLGVGLTVEHPEQSELQATLIHPGGLRVQLHNRTGTRTRNLITSYPDHSKPTETFSIFNGLNARGTWKLEVKDLKAENAGVLRGWMLKLEVIQTIRALEETAADGTFSFAKRPQGRYVITPVSTNGFVIPASAVVTNLNKPVQLDFHLSTNAPPTIRAQPRDQTVAPGGVGKFRVLAGGSNPFSYQWRLKESELPGETNDTLFIASVGAADLGKYSVEVRNSVGTILSEPAELRFDEWTEGNASQWTGFASDGAEANVFDEPSLLRSGSMSLRFETLSGFDTGIIYPREGNANWDLRNQRDLTFWVYGDNSNGPGFQGNQPIIVLQCAGGTIRYEPAQMAIGNRVWRSIRIPLAGSSAWRRTATGNPSLTAVNKIEIHQDTWDSGFTVYYDGLKFLPFSASLSAAQAGRLSSFNVIGTAGMNYFLQYSSDLVWWFDLAKLASTGATTPFQDPSSTDPYRFYRLLLP